MKRFDKRFSAISRHLDNADALIRSRRFREALSELETLPASSILETPSQDAAFYHYLKGYVLWELGEKKRGFVSAQKALEMYLALSNLDGIARSQKLAGSLLIDLGNLKSAREHLEIAVSTFKLSSQWEQAARALNQMAYLNIVQGKLKQALQYAEQAKESALKAKDRYYAIVQDGVVSVCYRLLGNWKLTLSYLREFLAETQKEGDFFNYVYGLINRGHAHFIKAGFREARKSYFEAIQVCEKESLVGNLKVACEFLAELDIAEGRFKDAEENLKKAAEIGERVSPYGTVMTQTWRKMGDLHRAKKEYDQALSAYETCRSYLIKLPERLEEGAMYRGMGICYLHQDQLTTAQSCFRKAIEIFEACENNWELAKTHVEAAESGVFALAEVRPKLMWAKGVFKELEHPSWAEQTDKLLNHPSVLEKEAPLRLAHELLEKERIARELEINGNNIARTAQSLGIPRSTLQSKIKRFKIEL